MEKRKIADTKKYNTLIKNGKAIKFYCDEMCPICCFVATYIEGRFIGGELVLISTGCMECGWQKYY